MTVKTVFRFFTSVLLAGCALLPFVAVHSPAASAQDSGWSSPAMISDPGNLAWQPEILAGSDGIVRALWLEGIDNNNRPESAAIYFSELVGENWTRPIDVIATKSGRNIAYFSSALDSQGNVFILWCGDGEFHISRNHVLTAGNAQYWQELMTLGYRCISRPKVLVDGNDRVHVAYVLEVNDVSEVLYMHSTDGGQTWSEPVALPEYEKDGLDPAELDMVVDDKGTLHIVVELADLSEGGWPGQGIYYAKSSDEGRSWSPPLLIDDIDSGEYRDGYGPFVPTLATAFSDEVHIVWYGSPRGERHHVYSLDAGDTWSANQQISTFRGMTWHNLMVTDSIGNVHLASGTIDDVIMYMVWQRDQWSEPTLISPQQLGPHYPSLGISSGNVLHLLFSGAKGTANGRIFHVSRGIGAAAILPTDYKTYQRAQFPEVRQYESIARPTHGSVNLKSRLPKVDIEKRDSIPPLPALLISVFMATVVVLAIVLTVVRRRTPWQL